MQRAVGMHAKTHVGQIGSADRDSSRGPPLSSLARAVSRDVPPVAELSPGVQVRHLTAGPFEDLDKADLPGQLCHFTFEVLRAEAEDRFAEHWVHHSRSTLGWEPINRVLERR